MAGSTEWGGIRPSTGCGSWNLCGAGGVWTLALWVGSRGNLRLAADRGMRYRRPRACGRSASEWRVRMRELSVVEDPALVFRCLFGIYSSDDLLPDRNEPEVPTWVSEAR